jgi:hypothetical protein
MDAQEVIGIFAGAGIFVAWLLFMGFLVHQLRLEDLRWQLKDLDRRLRSLEEEVRGWGPRSLQKRLHEHEVQHSTMRSLEARLESHERSRYAHPSR